LYSADYISAREEYLQALKKARKIQDKEQAADFENLSQMSRKRLEIMGLTSLDIEKISESDSSDSNLLPIHAPRDGFVMTKNATIGNLVNGGESLFIIADLKKVWFSGDVYPEDLSRIHQNQEVTIKSTEGSSFIPGKVSFVSPVVDPATRTIKIRALMDNSDNILRADMYVQGNLTLKRRKALLVPTQAIVRSQNDDIIFKKLNPLSSIERGFQGAQVKLTKVLVGQQGQGLTEIKEGIKDGDEVVSDGALLLYGALNEGH